MKFQTCDPHLIPLKLLLEADPSLEHIEGYRSQCWAMVGVREQEPIAACLILPKHRHTAEIMNLAVQEDYRRQGIGSRLLRYSLSLLKKKGIRKVALGTGSFGYQLGFYHRLGFRVQECWRNHFIDHYREPIYEGGIQHKDMLRLALDLSLWEGGDSDPAQQPEGI